MRVSLVVLALVLAGLDLPTPAFAEATAGRPDSRLPAAVAYAQAPATVEVDPIKCWWQTSRGAVTIGEIFDLSITCAVLENETVQVIPDESRLAVAAIQLSPFEILGGAHPADTRAGGRRFLQYRYSLRLIDRSAFGEDVKVPPQQVHYRVQTQVAADAALQGRDLIYILPAIPVRVLSQVPAEAADIRDGAGGLLDRAADLRARAGLLDIAALALAAAGVVVLLAAVVRMAGGARARTAAVAGRVPDGAVLRAAAAELEEARRRSQIEGWTPDLVARAAASVRVVAALGDGRKVSQQPLTGSLAGDRIAVEHGLWKKTRVSVSSAATPASLNGASSAPLAGALQALTRAAYGADTNADRAALDDAVEGALESARLLVRSRTGASAWLRARLPERRG